MDMHNILQEFEFCPNHFNGNTEYGVSCPSASNKLCLHFLAHLSRRLIGELIGYSWSGVRPLSVHSAQRSSSPKPLGQSKPNFIWSLLG